MTIFDLAQAAIKTVSSFSISTDILQSENSFSIFLESNPKFDHFVLGWLYHLAQGCVTIFVIHHNIVAESTF